MLTLILGGARSGKSRLAQKLASPAQRVTYIATAEAAQDAEMAARIARHRAERPKSWRTIEEPLALAGAVETAAAESDAILVDCLTIWLSNLFWEHREAGPGHVEDAARAELARIEAAARGRHVILVSNELGCGTVPEPAVTRSFRDSQGLLNQWAAEIADEVVLTVAGLPIYLKTAPSAMSGSGTGRPWACATGARRIVIAGTHSGVGKTTVATGIMAALRRRGLRVQGFKVGPDFIDPTFHEAATGRPSHNLDGWMLSRETNLDLFARASASADAVVVEGVMGLFDGKSSPSLCGTTAEMAIWLDAAVVLVLDAAAMAGSAAAIVHGFDTLVPEVRLAAVVCNRIASDQHFGYLRDAITARCRPAMLGYLPRDASFAIPERHLGLHLAQEALTEDRLARLAEWVESHLDLDLLLQLGARTELAVAPRAAPARKPVRTRIGIARDAAFCFYYRENLELLRSLGAEPIEFSPMADGALPADLDGIYLGGGYPELHAEALSANDSMLAAIAAFAAAGAPIYAECGGFLYLMQAIVDVEGRSWPMAGVFPTSARMQKRLAKLGYIEVESCATDGWLAPGERARGHEFRYSAIDPMPETVERVYREPAQGYRVGSVTGSYVHLHFLSCVGFAERFVGDCSRRREGRDG